MRALGAVLVVVSMATVAACSGDDDSDADVDAAPVTTIAVTTPATPAPAVTVAPDTTPAPTTTPDTTQPATTATTAAPPTTEPTVDAAWASFQVEGCMCSDGSDVTFFERIADPTRVVLYFQGGGACFNAATCDPNGSPTYTVNEGGMTAGDVDAFGGYFDFDNPENPLADYSWVYVPYCTGDVHIGDATTDYGDGVVVEHHGHPNAVSALDHLVALFPGAAKLVVTGESAGSVPTPQFAALAADLLPAAEIVTFGDSSAAYPDVDAINAVIGSVWGSTNAIPDWPETAGITATDWSFPEQYMIAGAHAPDVRFGRFDYAYDEVQAFFGSLAGVAADQLVTLIDQSEADIEASGVEVASYVAPGSMHTIASTDDLYTMEVGGVRLIDWLTELIDGAAPPPDVHCETCS